VGEFIVSHFCHQRKKGGLTGIGELLRRELVGTSAVAMDEEELVLRAGLQGDRARTLEHLVGDLRDNLEVDGAHQLDNLAVVHLHKDLVSLRVRIVGIRLLDLDVAESEWRGGLGELDPVLVQLHSQHSARTLLCRRERQSEYE